MLKQTSSEYKGYRNKGIRLNEDLSPQLSRIFGERSAVFFDAIHEFDLAHVVMLVEEKLIPRDAGIATLKVLTEMERIGVGRERAENGGGLHSGEQYAIRKLGEDVGGHMHLGRSSGDVSSVAISSVQRQKLLAAMAAINRFRATLLGLAEASTDLIMPGYSFGQHAQPVTVAHMYLSWASTLARDFQRHIQTYGRVNVSPAGAAIMVGSDFPLNRRRTAELLGYDGVHENAADAILELSPDDINDCAMVFAQVYHSLARWADDLIQWSTDEFQFVAIPDRYCITSSIMMQKKNVIGPAEIKGASAEALGCVVTCYHALKGPTGLAITERHFGLEILWRVGDNLVKHLDWFCDLLSSMAFNREHMLDRTSQHWATATDLAGALVRDRGLPWRTAHQIVGIAIRLAEERSVKPDRVTAALLDEASNLYHGRETGLSDAAIRRALDPRRFIDDRTLQGGPAPGESRRQAGLLRQGLAADAAALAAAEGSLEGARLKLRSAVGRLIGT